MKNKVLLSNNLIYKDKNKTLLLIKRMRLHDEQGMREAFHKRLSNFQFVDVSTR